MEVLSHPVLLPLRRHNPVSAHHCTRNGRSCAGALCTQAGRRREEGKEGGRERGREGRRRGGGRKKEEGTNKPDNKVAAAAAVSASVASDNANCWVCTGVVQKSVPRGKFTQPNRYFLDNPVLCSRRFKCGWALEGMEEIRIGLYHST